MYNQFLKRQFIWFNYLQLHSVVVDSIEGIIIPIIINFSNFVIKKRIEKLLFNDLANL